MTDTNRNAGNSSQPTSTHTTPNGTTVYRDPNGGVHFPSRSAVTDIHDSNSGKSFVIDHKDGIREVHDKVTGKVSYAREPIPAVDKKYVAPVNAPVKVVTRREVDVTKIVINNNNTYLREPKSYYRSEPVFYSGYRWQPPVFNPIYFAAGMALANINELYRPEYFRDSVSNMTGANWYAAQFAAAGVNNSFDLVNSGRTQADRQRLSDFSGVPYGEVRKAVGQADLMRVDGIGAHNSRLLVDAGINSMQDLARYSWDPVGLYDQLKFSSYWDGARAPSLRQVESWIDQARNLPQAIFDDNLDAGPSPSAQALQAANDAAGRFQTGQASDLYRQAADTAVTSGEARRAGNAAADHFLTDAASHAFRKAGDNAIDAQEAIDAGNDAAGHFLTDAATYAFERGADRSTSSGEASLVSQAAASHFLTEAANYAGQKAASLPY